MSPNDEAAGKARRPGSSRLRSFRLAGPTADALQLRSELTGKSQNSLVQRYVDEGLRRDAHPYIDFRQGIGSGAPILSGTRVKVSHIVRMYKQGASVEQIAADLMVPPDKIQAAVRYYAEFTEEIDRHIAGEDDYAERAYNAWLREQEIAQRRGAPKGKKRAS